MGNSHRFRIGLCIAIIASFFLPLNSPGSESLGMSLTAWNILTDAFKNLSQIKDASISGLLTVACLLAVLLSTMVILLTSFSVKAMPGFLYMLPLIAISVMIGYSINNAKESVSDFFKATGVGLYVMLVGSFLLPFAGLAEGPSTAYK